MPSRAHSVFFEDENWNLLREMAHTKNVSISRLVEEAVAKHFYRPPQDDAPASVASISQAMSQSGTGAVRKPAWEARDERLRREAKERLEKK
jgi:hypothetical protein